MTSASPVKSYSVIMFSDAGYAAPTAVVARTIADRCEPELDTVYFVWAGLDAPPDELDRYLAGSNVKIVRMPRKLVEGLGNASVGHLGSISLARLHFASILESYPIRQFVYLDGDVDVLGPLAPLGLLPLAPGHIAAAGIKEELMPSGNPEKLKSWARHLERLGLKPQNGYFNAGVVLADMEAWAVLGREALAFYWSNQGACRYLDQDALNAVAMPSRQRLSPRYNFQRVFFSLGLEEILRPRILHFNVSWKPWMATPFTRTWQSRKPFEASKEAMPGLWNCTYPNRLPLPRKAAYHAGALRKTVKESFGSAKRREAFLSNLASTCFLDGAFGPDGASSESDRGSSWA